MAIEFHEWDGRDYEVVDTLGGVLLLGDGLGNLFFKRYADNAKVVLTGVGTYQEDGTIELEFPKDCEFVIEEDVEYESGNATLDLKYGGMAAFSNSDYDDTHINDGE